MRRLLLFLLALLVAIAVSCSGAVASTSSERVQDHRISALTIRVKGLEAEVAALEARALLPGPLRR